MGSKIADTISGMLNEEKWTRATLNDYIVSHFEELDVLIKKGIEEGEQKEILALCDEHLKHTKNSIVALYIAGILSLSRQQLDDTHLMNLIAIFADNHKWGAVEYLCQRILDFGENKEALRTLAETLEHMNQHEKKSGIWERLIKVDYSETDIVRKLAEVREESGDIEGAILYYRKAIHRFVNKNLFNSVRSIWEKLVSHGFDDYEFFFLIEKKVAKTMNSERATNLLEELYPAIKERSEWKTAIEVLKRILSYDSKNNWARLEIIDCYKEFYSDHSQLEEYIRLSNLNQNWRNVLEAIADFEKHISFDAGNFVFHKTWGVGIIREAKGDKIVIDFAKKREHAMSLKMAVDALQSLSRDHIWVLKSIYPKEKLKIKIKKDIPWTLSTIIRSYGNAADIKKIKAELVPSILSPGEWTSWNSNARTILKTDEVFGNVPDKIDQFIVRDKPMSFEEKTFNQFKAEKHLFKKIQTARDFLNHSDPDSEFFGEIFEFFTSFLNSGNVDFQVTASFLFVAELSKTYPFLNPGLDWGFTEMWSDMEDPVQIFSELDDASLRKEFLQEVRENIENWQQIYLSLFPIQMSQSILDGLLAAGCREDVIAKLEEMVEHFRTYREGLIWIARQFVEESWIQGMGLNSEKIFINIIRLLDITFNDISSKRDSTNNRRINRQIQNFLFKENHLERYILDGNEETAGRIFPLLESIKDLDPVIKRTLKEKVQKAFPNIRFYGDKKVDEAVSVASTRYFFAMQTSLSAKQKELKQIIDVEIPKNSKEIGAAIELGDLSENAEYKAGKERQENLQIQVGRLKEELERVRLFTEKERNSGTVEFATVVTLKNLIETTEEQYTILGPWESDPSSKIISYLSPFGSALLGKKKGDELDFVINDRKYNLEILAVENLSLS